MRFYAEKSDVAAILLSNSEIRGGRRRRLKSGEEMKSPAKASDNSRTRGRNLSYYMEGVNMIMTSVQIEKPQQQGSQQETSQVFLWTLTAEKWSP